MMKRFALILALSLTACSGEIAGEGVEGPVVTGRTFQSTEVTGRSLAEGTKITLTFPEAAKISANAGCNHLFGKVVFEGDRMVVTEMGGTDMGCDQARHDQDKWLTGFLQAKPRWSQNGDTLKLTGEGQAITLTDRKVTEPDKALEGNRWVVDTLIDGQTASSVPAGAEAYMQFERDKMTGNNGCNHMGGVVAHSPGKVTITDVVSTKMACEGARGELEKFVMDVLNGGPLDTKVTGDYLELKNAKGKGLRLKAQS